MQNDKTKGRIITRVALTICLVLLVLFLWHFNKEKEKANSLKLKSQYTFNITLDGNGNVIDDGTREAAESESTQQDDSETSAQQNEFAVSTDVMADKWIDRFTGQFTPLYVQSSKALKNVKIEQINVLSENDHTAYIKFSAKLRDKSTEYFSSWNGVSSGNRMVFEWVVTFKLDVHSDNTATIYPAKIQSSSEYGITDSSSQDSSNSQTESETKSSSSELTGYQIKNHNLMVTFDGGEKYVTVPVDIDNLIFKNDEKTKLIDGSFMIDNAKTAFLYGGNTHNDKNTPVTLIYSNDKGANWVTCEIGQIYDVYYFYVNFFGNSGVIVAGYPSDDNQEGSKIYLTSDGGENWTSVGAGPLKDDIDEVNFVDEKTGFICYKYADGMDSNLYMTKDGGMTFSKVVFQPQELDSSAANSNSTGVSGGTNGEKLQWNDVYKVATVPEKDSDGKLTVYLKQTDNGIYNNGKTAAKYQSADNGNTWEYVGQMEINGKTERTDVNSGSSHINTN